MSGYDDLVHRLRVAADYAAPYRAQHLNRAADAIEALAAENARLRLERSHANDCADAAIAGQHAAEADNARLREALTPSTATKIAYIGEFSFTVPDRDEDGDEIYRKVMIPWTSVKEIMRAISERAALATAPLATKPVDDSAAGETDSKGERE